MGRSFRVPEQWSEEQRRLAKLRVDQDQTDWRVCGKSICGLDRVGGVDISFFPDQTYAVAAVVVISFKSFEVLYARCANIRLAVPYIPGYLAFREVPALATLLEEIPQELKPQVVLVDGNGAFHPRGCGSASHLGILAELPTIGVAKTVQKVDNVTQKRGFKLAERLKGASDSVPLLSAADEEEGKKPLAMLLRPGSGKGTLVVSSGHRVSLDTAVTLTVKLCRNSRMPEPIRQADRRSRVAICEWFGGKDAGDLEVCEGLLPALPSLKRPSSAGPKQPLRPRKAKGRKKRRAGEAESAESTAEELEQPGKRSTWRVKAAAKAAAKGLDAFAEEITNERQEKQRARARLRTELVRARAEFTRKLGRASGDGHLQHPECKEQHRDSREIQRKDEEDQHVERKEEEWVERKEDENKELHEEEEEDEDEGEGEERSQQGDHEVAQQREDEGMQCLEGEGTQHKDGKEPQNEVVADTLQQEQQKGKERQYQERQHKKIGYWKSCILLLGGLCCLCGGT